MSDQKIMDLVRKFGSVAKIPETELALIGFSRIEDPNRQSVGLVPTDVLKRRQQSAQAILKKYQGYLYARDYELLHRVAAKESNINDAWLKKIYNRARRLQEAGFPPLHQPEHFGRSRGVKYIEIVSGPRGRSWKELHGFSFKFPNIDFIVTYATRQIGKKQAALIKAAQDAAGPSVPVKFHTAATVDDFQLFVASAFANGRFHAPFRAEILSYVRQRWNFQDEDRQNATIDNLEATMDHLERVLAPMSAQTQVNYQEWSGDIHVVDVPFWFTDFDPHDHDRIARAYFGSLDQRRRPTGKDKEVAIRMCDAFEHLAPDWLLRVVRGQLVEEALITNNYRGLPRWMLAPDAPDRRAFEGALRHFQGICERMVRDTDVTITLPILTLPAEFQMPQCLFEYPEFLDAINRARIRVIEKMSDEAFLERFVAKNGRFEAKSYAQDGHKTGREASELGQAVLATVRARAVKLGLMKSVA